MLILLKYIRERGAPEIIGRGHGALRRQKAKGTLAGSIGRCSMQARRRHWEVQHASSATPWGGPVWLFDTIASYVAGFFFSIDLP
jgi:hypothetical protein